MQEASTHESVPVMIVEQPPGTPSHGFRHYDIPVSPWAYIPDASFPDPFNWPRMATRHAQRPVVLARENMQPEGGFRRALSSAPAERSCDETKIIYALRHGETPHNEDSSRFGTPVAWRYLSALAKNHDPRLTPDGLDSVARAACYLGDEAEAPRPVTVCSSPLRRCIETAFHFIKQAGLQHRVAAGAPPLTLHINEGLREWMGYGHNHQSDHCGNRAEVAAFVHELSRHLAVDIPCRLDVPEREDFHDEVYVDVDQRVRRALDHIFDDAHSGACVMLVMHNRSHKSLLRVLGHTPEGVDDFDIDNCVMLPYRVTRRLMSTSHVGGRVRYESDLRGRDLAEAERKKEQRRNEAIRNVRSWANAEGDTRARLDNLFEFLRGFARQGDPAATVALELLQADLAGPDV